MKKLLLSLMLVLSLVAIAPTTFAIIAPTPPLPHCDYAFEDVDCYQTYFPAIEFLKISGIVQGYSNGTYQPENPINRAEMMKIISEGAKKYFEWEENVFDEYAVMNCFPDVPVDAWYNKYVCYGKLHSWVQGYNDGTFRPEQNINFVEALKITMRGYSIVEYAKDTDPWYRGIVDRASKSNYIPFTVSSFVQEINRGEMADMIARIIKYSEGGFDEYLDRYDGKADTAITYEDLESGDLSEIRIQGK